MNTRPVVLFAEDSEDDALLIQRGFEAVHFPLGMQFVTDGFGVVEYLTGAEPYVDRARFPLPRVLLTDLKMPRMGGFELLEWLGCHEKYRRIPTIVITGSDQTEDRRRAIELGARAYVTKELLIRPPPGLVDAILRCASPVPAALNRGWSRA